VSRRIERKPAAFAPQKDTMEPGGPEERRLDDGRHSHGGMEAIIGNQSAS